jgi:CRISPR-associated endonuclease/helicase Cas3
VDTVGRGLLFSGFGCGAARRATLAGLLGQDALLVIDDAHHEPAFQRLCQAVADEQRREGGLRRLHSLSLLPSWQGPGDIHRLDDTDLADPAVRRRLEAVKKLRLHPLEDARREAEGLTTLALALKDCGRAVAVFARDADSAEAVTKALRRHAPAELLTERLRGYELDSLVATSGVFARFLPTAERRSEPTARTVYLVCTEGGEVGVNTSADHVVADLVPFERMAQRFARLNRFGDRTDAEAHVLYPAHFDRTDALGPARARTLGLLRSLSGDANQARIARLDETEVFLASTPVPTFVSPTEVTFDAWALTTPGGRLSGRPPVERYVYGYATWGGPETAVAWRDEVAALSPIYGSAEERTARQAADRKRLSAAGCALLERYPLEAFELLREDTARVADQLRLLARRKPFLPAWVLAWDGTVSVHTVSDLVQEGGTDRLADRTLVLPPAAGALLDGRLSGTATAPDTCDVADRFVDVNGLPRRMRRRERSFDPDPPPGMSLVFEFDTEAHTESSATEPSDRFFRWYVRSRAATGSPNELRDGTVESLARADRLVGLLLPNREGLHRSIAAAARLYALGTKRRSWVRVSGYLTHGRSDGASPTAELPPGLTDYRYEFGSLLDAAADPAYGVLKSDEERDLALHLVAALRGRARPHFPASEAVDPERPADACASAAREVPARFARLQRTFGRWGLAYLESLLRAAVSPRSPARQSPLGGSPA